MTGSHAESITDARRFLALLAMPGEVFELRGLSKGRSAPMVTAGYFDNMEALATAACDRSGADEGVYVTINPVNPALLARAPANRVRQAGNGDTTSDRDVQRRAHLLVDVDPIRPAGISSTDAEHTAALELAHWIAQQLDADGWPEPLRGDSGNGAHLIYAIDLPVDDGGLVKRVLGELSRRFTSATLKVDEKVFNPARISKVFGTLTRKGENAADRPHRVSTIIAAPSALAVVTRAQLESLAPIVSITPPRSVPLRNGNGNGGSYAYSNGTTTTAPAKFDLDSWLGDHLPDAIASSWSSGRKWLLPVCPINSEHNRREAYVTQKDDGSIAAGCQHESCFKSWHELRTHFEPDAYDRRATYNADGRRLTTREPPPEILYEIEREEEIEEDRPTDSISTAPAPAPSARPIGRTWDSCVDEIYERQGELWIDIQISGTAIAECRNGSFVPLIAPSGSGKSTLAIQMLIDHALHRGPGVLLTYELDGDEAVARGIGQLCLFGWASVMRGAVPREMVPAVDRLRVLERDNATLANLATVVAELRALYPDQPVLVIVDYLQATPATPGLERGHTANISVELRRAAKALRVVLIGVSQASTANAKRLRDGELVGIDSAATGAETSQIERDAYVILTLGDRQIVDDDTVSWKLSVAKYRLGSADQVYELHYRGRVGTWEIVGAPRSANEVRDSRETEVKAKKTDELKRAIVAWVAAQPAPVSAREIKEVSTGRGTFVLEVVRELVKDGALVHTGAVVRGGAARLCTPGQLGRQS